MKEPKKPILVLTIINTEKVFEVRVHEEDRTGRAIKIVKRLNWYGGTAGHPSSHPFTYKGRHYVVFGPYHEFRGIEDFVLYEMTEIARSQK